MGECFLVFSVLVSHEDVITQLAADTLDYGACVGLKGRRFGPGEFSELANVVMKVRAPTSAQLVLSLYNILLLVEYMT